MTFHHPHPHHPQLPRPLVDLVISVCGRPFPANIFAILLSDVHDRGSLRATLNDGNVQQIMLHAQILQLSDAVIACKEYLTARQQQQQHQQKRPTLVFKPIASKPLVVVPPPPQLRLPLPFPPNLLSGESFLAAATAAFTLGHTWPWRDATAPTALRAPPPPLLPYSELLLQLNSSSLQQIGYSIPPPPPPLPSPVQTPPLQPIPIAMRTSASKPQTKLLAERLSREPVPMREEEQKLEVITAEETDATTTLKTKDSEPDLVVDDIAPSNLDVAACDGPVTFHRIPNPYLETSREIDEADKIATSTPSDSSKGSKTFKCLFCSHIFKSHYCYQKHKRRHINPFAVDFEKSEASRTEGKDSASSSSSSVASCSNADGGEGSKRHLLRDINVQFFPCKICGAKFPSYYFVHKHKKMWHSSEELAAADAADLADAAESDRSRSPQKNSEKEDGGNEENVCRQNTEITTGYKQCLSPVPPK